MGEPAVDAVPAAVAADSAAAVAENPVMKAPKKMQTKHVARKRKVGKFVEDTPAEEEELDEATIVAREIEKEVQAAEEKKKAVEEAKIVEYKKRSDAALKQVLAEKGLKVLGKSAIAEPVLQQPTAVASEAAPAAAEGPKSKKPKKVVAIRKSPRAK